MAFIGGVSGGAGRGTCVRRGKVCMAMQQERGVAAKVAAVSAAMLAMPAIAAEGTGAPLGVEEPLLYLPLILVPTAFFVLYLGFAREQPNDDFFGETDDRRE